ncbi:MAG TPA: AAA family ATPase, partial [Candidatus Handelsmanbacteria bacterium]|nr:AAA family ATPase [Candidatus Handelsmanbacteria bacterium]
WHIKSTTRAIDGLYHYDVVQRLNDARFGEGDISDISQYIRLGVLGQAFESEQPAVLLIDEVDKAEVEFPNDLLRELDEMAFHISELDKTITAQHRPLVIITSNAERDLPDAFLRRCLFHYITFPTRERLEQIVDVHMPDLEQELLTVALERFMAFRKLPGLRQAWGQRFRNH